MGKNTNLQTQGRNLRNIFLKIKFFYTLGNCEFA